MNLETWRTDFEELDYDARVFTCASSAASVIEESQSLEVRGTSYAELSFSTPHKETFVVVDKVTPTKACDFVVYSFSSLESRWSNWEGAFEISGSWHKFLSQSPIVISRSFEEATRVHTGIWYTFHALVTSPAFPKVAAFHRLTRGIYKALVDIPGDTKKGMEQILEQFARTVPYRESRRLPALRLGQLEDSTYLVEWILSDRRLGFVFEQTSKDSGWYLVLSSDSSERYESGSMDQLELSRLVQIMLRR